MDSNKKSSVGACKSYCMNFDSFILLFKGLHLFEPDFFLFQNTHIFLYLVEANLKDNLVKLYFFFFWFQNTHTFLCLSKDKTKG